MFWLTQDLVWQPLQILAVNKKNSFFLVHILGGENLLEKCQREILKRPKRGLTFLGHVSDSFSDLFIRVFQTLLGIDLRVFRGQFR